MDSMAHDQRAPPQEIVKSVSRYNRICWGIGSADHDDQADKVLPEWYHPSRIRIF